MVWAMSKIQEMQAALRALSPAELLQVRDWLDDLVEDEMEFTAEFEAAVRQSEREMSEGTVARVREPGHE
jgi:hypothetical protein